MFPANSERAPDWFALYEYNNKGEQVKNADGTWAYKSECAKQLQGIAACSDSDMIEQAFGGFDVVQARRRNNSEYGQFVYTLPNDNTTGDLFVRYGLVDDSDNTTLKHRYTRPTGVATEVYNQIISILSTQCMNLQGRFMEYQFFDDGAYDTDNLCKSNFANSRYGDDSILGTSLVALYGVGEGEDMCPRDYNLGVATQSWGACLCWENGARRSKWGKSAKCVAAVPSTSAADATCSGTAVETATDDLTENDWCVVARVSDLNQACAPGMTLGYDDGDYQTKYCIYNNDTFGDLPKGIE